MKKPFKRVIASVMAVATLVVSAVGVSANAASENSYARIGGARDGSYAMVWLKNKTSSKKYGQVNCYVYTSNGAYVTNRGEAGKVPGGQSISVEPDDLPISNTYIYEGEGTLYLTELPQGTPVAVLNIGL